MAGNVITENLLADSMARTRTGAESDGRELARGDVQPHRSSRDSQPAAHLVGGEQHADIFNTGFARRSNTSLPIGRHCRGSGNVLMGERILTIVRRQNEIVAHRLPVTQSAS